MTWQIEFNKFSEHVEFMNIQKNENFSSQIIFFKILQDSKHKTKSKNLVYLGSKYF